MSADAATLVAASAFIGLTAVSVVRGLRASRRDDRSAPWSTWGVLPFALAGLLATLLVRPDTVPAWTGACFALYAVWAAGQVVAIARSREPEQGWLKYMSLLMVSLACVTIVLFPRIAG